MAVFGGRCACQCLLHFIRRCALPAFWSAKGSRRSPPAVAAAVPVVLAAVVVHTGVAFVAGPVSADVVADVREPAVAALLAVALIEEPAGGLTAAWLGGSCFLPLPGPFACFLGLSLFT